MLSANGLMTAKQQNLSLTELKTMEDMLIYHHFLLFPQYFQKASLPGSLKPGLLVMGYMVCTEASVWMDGYEISPGSVFTNHSQERFLSFSPDIF